MGNWRESLNLTLIVGRSDFGKTTFAFRYLYNAPDVICRFIFDDQGRDGRRLEEWNIGIRPAFTADDLEKALASQWVVFNPARMFPDDPGYKNAFNFFCDWVYRVSTRGRGRKLVLVNEVWQYQDRGQMPGKLATLVQAAREEQVECIFATQLPHQVNASITGQCTELVAFRVGECDTPDGLHLDPALNKVQSMGIPAADVLALDKGQFIALNKLSRGKLSGRLW